MENSRRDLSSFIWLLIGLGLSLKTKLRSHPASPPYPKKVWDYLKKGGVDFIVYKFEF